MSESGWKITRSQLSRSPSGCSVAVLIVFKALFTNVHSTTSLTFCHGHLVVPEKKTNEIYTQSSECRLHQRCAAHISGVPLTSAVCRSHQRCAASISGVPLTLSGVPLTSAVCRFHQRCAAYISGVPLTSPVCRLHQRCEYIYNLY